MRREEGGSLGIVKRMGWSGNYRKERGGLGIVERNSWSGNCKKGGGLGMASDIW